MVDIIVCRSESADHPDRGLLLNIFRMSNTLNVQIAKRSHCQWKAGTKKSNQLSISRESRDADDHDGDGEEECSTREIRVERLFVDEGVKRVADGGHQGLDHSVHRRQLT